MVGGLAVVAAAGVVARAGVECGGGGRRLRGLRGLGGLGVRSLDRKSVV